MQSSHVIEKSAKRTKLGHLKASFPSSSPLPASVYLVQGFSSILLVGELMTPILQMKVENTGMDIGRAYRITKKYLVVRGAEPNVDNVWIMQEFVFPA